MAALSPSPVAGPGAPLLQWEEDVQAGAAYALRFRLHDPQGALPNAALLALSFLDERGARLDGPHPGLHHSRKLGREVVYLASSDTAVENLTAPWLVPRGACRIALAVWPWKGSRAMVMPVPPSLCRQAFSPQALQAIEAQDMQAAAVACQDALDQAPRRVDLLAHAVGLSARLGRADWLHACCEALLSHDEAPGLAQRRAHLALGQLQEMSPDWLPRVEGRLAKPSAAGRRQVQRLPCVVHLLGSPTGAAPLRPPRNWRAVWITPTEYSGCAAPEGPWRMAPPPGASPSGASGADAPHYVLDWLAASWVAEVARPRLLQMDAWLGSRIALAQRARLIHAQPGARGYDLALRALAMGERLGLPVVYEYDPAHVLLPEPGQPAWPPDSEMAMRRGRQALRCLGAAAAIVVRTPAQKRSLRGVGIDAAKVFVVGPRGDCEAAYAHAVSAD